MRHRQQPRFQSSCSPGVPHSQLFFMSMDDLQTEMAQLVSQCTLVVPITGPHAACRISSGWSLIGPRGKLDETKKDRDSHWAKWRQASGTVYKNKRIPVKLKEDQHCSMSRGFCVVNKSQERKISGAEMRMLEHIMGSSRRIGLGISISGKVSG